EGNKRIKEIQDSEEPVEAKVPQIVAALHQHRALANMAAAKYSGNVFDAMQRILDAEGSGQSARQFAQAHGADVGNMFRRPDDDASLTNQVRSAVTGGPTTNLTGNAGTPPGTQPTSPGPQPPPHGTANLTSN